MRENRFDPLGLLKNILAFLVVSAISFAWTMTVLLIVSFVALSYVKIKLDLMLIISTVAMTVVDVIYVVRKLRKKD